MIATVTDERNSSAPFEPGTDQWATFRTTHSVLLIAHNITTLGRLLDVIPAFDNDVRIQLFITCTDGNWSGHAGSHARPSASMTRVSKVARPCLAAVDR